MFILQTDGPVPLLLPLELHKPPIQLVEVRECRVCRLRGGAPGRFTPGDGREGRQVREALVDARGGGSCGRVGAKGGGERICNRHAR